MMSMARHVTAHALNSAAHVGRKVAILVAGVEPQREVDDARDVACFAEHVEHFAAVAIDDGTADHCPELLDPRAVSDAILHVITHDSDRSRRSVRQYVADRLFELLRSGDAVFARILRKDLEHFPTDDFLAPRERFAKKIVAHGSAGEVWTGDDEDAGHVTKECLEIGLIGARQIDASDGEAGGLLPWPSFEPRI